MEKSVLLLYEGDGWLSTDSLVLMGIFDSIDELTNAAHALVNERIDEHVNYAIECCNEDENEITKESVLDDIIEELIETRQYLGETSYIIKEVELNKLEEV